MSMEIRQSNFVIHSNTATIPCPGLELGPGEKLLATWYVPTDNVGSQLPGYVTIAPTVTTTTAGDQVAIEVRPLEPSPPDGHNPMRVIVFAMLDVPLIKVGTGKLFSDEALTKPETRLVNSDHAFLGVPVTNTSDILVVKSISLSLDFNVQTFDEAGVLLSPAPPIPLVVETIGPRETKNARVKVVTQKNAKLPQDLQFLLKVEKVELGVADTLVQKNVRAEVQNIHLGS